MKEEYVKPWVDALRSGKYKQYKGGALKSPDHAFNESSYCCLGVLCDILGEPVPKISAFEYKHYLPAAIVLKVGLFNSSGGHRDWDDVTKSLSYINDKYADFGRIANEIEKHWELL